MRERFEGFFGLLFIILFLTSILGMLILGFMYIIEKIDYKLFFEILYPLFVTTLVTYGIKECLEADIDHLYINLMLAAVEIPLSVYMLADYIKTYC